MTRAAVVQAMMGDPARAAVTPMSFPGLGQQPVNPPQMENYNPSWRDRVADALGSAANYISGKPYSEARQDSMTLMGLAPVTGQAMAAEDAGRAYGNGDYVGAAMAGLGAIPDVGPEARALAAKSIKEGAQNLMDSAASKGVDLYLSPSARKLTVSKIVVPPQMRGQGVGSSVMKEITDYADANGVTLALDPSTDFGGSKAGLDRFYSRHGFESNLGRKRDFEITEAMRRYPQSTDQASKPGT